MSTTTVQLVKFRDFLRELDREYAALSTAHRRGDRTAAEAIKARIRDIARKAEALGRATGEGDR